jgi:hypothetical protein
MLSKLKSLWLILALSLFAGQVMAFPCFITMVKGSCWKDYTVKVDVLDAEDNTVLMTITVPKGTSWTRQSFEAKPKQRFMLRSSFTPTFWKEEDKALYYAKRYWSLPEEVKGDTIAWNVGACFPGDFSEVPMPPNQKTDCVCDKREIPTVGQE